MQTNHTESKLKQVTTPRIKEYPLLRLPEHLRKEMRFLFLITMSRHEKTQSECCGSQEPGEFD